jgi:hypothetical protein
MLIVLIHLPLVTHAFSIERYLGVGEFCATYRNANADWRIEGSFSVTNDIEFFICDSGNFTNWVSNESVVLHEHFEETMGRVFNFTVPYN